MNHGEFLEKWFQIESEAERDEVYEKYFVSLPFDEISRLINWGMTEADFAEIAAMKARGEITEEKKQKIWAEVGARVAEKKRRRELSAVEK